MATSTTLTESLSTTVSNFVVTELSNRLSEWLKTKKSVDVSAEDICEALREEYTPSSRMAGLPAAANIPTQMPHLPGYWNGAGASPAKSSRGGRKKAQVDPNAPKCIYKFQRGKRQNEVCGTQVSGDGSPGSDQYCKNCLKKKTVQSKINTDSTEKSRLAPPIFPNGLVSVPEQGTPDSTENSLNAVHIPGSEDLLKIVDHGFIVRQESNGNIVAISMEESDGTQRPLTEEEKVTAQSLGISIVEGPREPSPVMDANIPAIPQIP